MVIHYSNVRWCNSKSLVYNCSDNQLLLHREMLWLHIFHTPNWFPCLHRNKILQCWPSQLPSNCLPSLHLSNPKHTRHHHADLSKWQDSSHSSLSLKILPFLKNNLNVIPWVLILRTQYNVFSFWQMRLGISTGYGHRLLLLNPWFTFLNSAL